MVKRPGMPETGRGGGITPQHVLRLITILVGIVGLSVLGLAYYRRHFAAKEPPKTQATPGPKSTGTDAAGAPEDNATAVRSYPVDTRSAQLLSPREEVKSAFLGPILDGPKAGLDQLGRLVQKVEKHLPADDPVMVDAREVSLKRLAADPDKFREQQVSVRGTLAYLKRVRIPENAFGIRNVVEGELDVAGEGRCVFVASRSVQIEEGEEVVVRGLFMQMLTRPGAAGGQVQAPLVVTSHPIRVASQKDATALASTMITIVVVLFMLYFVMMLMLRRKSQRRNPILEGRRKVRELMRSSRGETPAEPLEEDSENDDEHGAGQPG